MKAKFLLILFIMFLTVVAYGQQTFCADSSYRIKYIFGNNGTELYLNPDTSGTNIFFGGFIEGANRGIGLLKTNWGDSMLWAKKIYVNGESHYSVNAPNGSIVFTGIYGSASATELMISKLANNDGTVQWIKRFRLASGHLSYDAGNFQRKTLLIANNAIYFNGMFKGTGGNYIVAAKLDLNGNILWSKSFLVNLPRSAITLNKPAFYNNSLIVASSVFEQLPNFNWLIYTSLTKLNDADGSIMENNAYKILPNPLKYGTIPILLNVNADSTFSLTGNFTVSDLSGGYAFSDIIYNSEFDKNLSPLSNNYYKNNVPLSGPDFQFDFNNKKTHVLLAPYLFNQTDKYFITFGSDNDVLRSRKFTIPSIFSSIYRTSVNLDDKQNLHFLFHYPVTTPGSPIISEYARISNFAPSSTLGCFGKDTSILTQYPFNLTKEAFVWDNIQSDVIVSNDVPYTEDTAIVTKELVCKIVSICDSVYIKGPASACLGQPVRYTVSKNSGCFKNLDWQMDTSFVNIINTEGDSAITISFKKAFTGYLHAAITDCVVKDSFFVTVLPSPKIKITNRDSLLCPGKIIVLKANPGFAAYKWQDGSSADTLQVTTAGFYKVTGTDNCAFKTADSITINKADTSFTLPATQTICLYDTAFILLPADVNNITWQPANNGLLSNKTLLLFPRQTTTYQITAERLANCTLTATSQVVIQNCVGEIFIPNTFTPNNDNHNDVFKASAFRPLQIYHLEIYNRYGQKIFETNNIATGWDGNFKGNPAETGTYVWSLSYIDPWTGKEVSTKGTSILIR